MSTVRSLFHGWVPVNGVPTLISEGEEFDVDHPVVEARPDLFTQPRQQTRAATKGKASDG